MCSFELFRIRLRSPRLCPVERQQQFPRQLAGADDELAATPDRESVGRLFHPIARRIDDVADFIDFQTDGAVDVCTTTITVDPDGLDSMPNRSRTSNTVTIWPRRFINPSTHEGASGTGVVGRDCTISCTRNASIP